MRAAVLWLVAAALLGGLPAVPSASAGPAPRHENPRLENPRLDESSGLAASRLHPGLFWSHNDSGGIAELFAIDGQGADRGSVTVRHAPAEDWEDVAMDAHGNLWVLDGGNNKNRRQNLRVIRVPEPKTLSGEVAADRVVTYRFPEQTEFPPKAKNFDSEALFWDGDRLLLLSKHRADTMTVLYAFPAGFESDPRWAPGGDAPPPLALEKLGTFDVGGNMDNYGGQVTGADLSPDGEHLAVLTYHALFVFDRPAGESPLNWLAGPHRRIDFMQLVTMQCEAVAWDGGEVLFTNEGRAVMRIRQPFSDACRSYPSPACTAAP